MTKLETQHVLGKLAELAPKLFAGKWALTPAQADVLAEKIGAIHNLTPEQVVIALREHVATTKFVSLQSVVECLRTLSKFSTPSRGVSPLAVDPESTAGRLRRFCKQTGLSYDTPAHELVVRWWQNWAMDSMRIRGECPTEPFFRQFKADCIELARMGEAEVDEWWYSIVDGAQHIQHVPEMGAMWRKAEGIARAIKATEEREKARERDRVEAST